MLNPAEITKDQLLILERWAALTVAYRTGTLSPEDEAEWNQLGENNDFQKGQSRLNDESFAGELLEQYANAKNNVESAIADFHEQAAEATVTPNRSYHRI